MAVAKRRRSSDIDPGGQRGPNPQNENRRVSNTPSKQGRRLDSDIPRGPREPRGYNFSGRSRDSHPPGGWKGDSYRPPPSGDLYRPRPIGDSYRPCSYRPDSSRPSRAAENRPVSSRAEDSVRPRGRSPLPRSRQQGASNGGDVGCVTRQPVADHKDGIGILNDANGWSPRSQDGAGSRKFRDSNSKSPVRAGKVAAVEECNEPPGGNTGARDLSESSLAHTRDSSKFSTTGDSSTLQPESHDLGQPTQELTPLGQDNTVTTSADGQPNNSVPHLKGREESPEGTSRSIDSLSSSSHNLDSQGEENSSVFGSSRVFGKPRIPRVFLHEFEIPPLEPEDFLPNPPWADRGPLPNPGTPSELNGLDPGNAPIDDSWRYTDFTLTIHERLYGWARLAKNRKSAALLPPNVPLFGPRIRKPRARHQRSQKTRLRGSLKRHHQTLSNKEKTERDDESSSEEEDGPLTKDTVSGYWVLSNITQSARPHEPKKDPAPSKVQQENPSKGKAQAGSENGPLTKATVRGFCVPSNSTQGARPNRPKKDLAPSKVQQENPSKGKAQAGSENGPLTKGTVRGFSVPSNSTQGARPNEPKKDPAPSKVRRENPSKGKAQAGSENGTLTKGTVRGFCVPSNSTQSARPTRRPKKDPAPSKVQQENPSKGKAQAGSENGTLTKGTLGCGGVPGSSTHNIAPTKKLAMARGKQLRPEIVQALAMLRASRSDHPKGEHEGGHLSLVLEVLSVTTPEIPDCTGEEGCVPDAPGK